MSINKTDVMRDLVNVRHSEQYARKDLFVSEILLLVHLIVGLVFFEITPFSHSVNTFLGVCWGVFLASFSVMAGYDFSRCFRFRRRHQRLTHLLVALRLAGGSLP